MLEFLKLRNMKFLLPVICLLFCCLYAVAQQKTIPLYEGSIPNAKKVPAIYVEETDSDGRVTQVSEPALLPFFPDKKKSTGTAILIFPGGGYRLLSLSACEEIARRLSEEGIAAFIVKYRLPNDSIMIDRSIGPLQDAQAAIRLVRKKAAEWGIDPHKIGTMGLSAGGHVVSMEGTQLARRVIENKDSIDLRPDFMALLYPVIIYDPAVPKTRKKLIGANPSSEFLSLYSTDKSVSKSTPPTFLVHAVDDDVIPVKNSLAFFDALLLHNVKVEMHILQSGGHGFALTDLNSHDNWYNHFKSWLTENGF